MSLNKKIRMLLTAVLVCVCVLGATLFSLEAYAQTDYRGWRVDGSEITAFDKTGVSIENPTTVNNGGIIENYLNASYVYNVDMNAGQQFSYMIPDDMGLSVGEEVYVFERPNETAIVDRGDVINDARYFNHSYVKFTVKNQAGEGFEVVFYHQYSQDNVGYANKIFANLYYLSPSITEDLVNNKQRGRHYVETVYSYEPHFGVWHTLSCFSHNGWFFISADGTSFVPQPEYGNFDLSKATVTVEAKSIDMPEMQLCLKTPETKFERNVYDNWMTLGESNVDREDDGTLKFEVDEKNDRLSWNSASSGNLLLRERVSSLKGYSVDEPIVIDCCLDGDGPQNYLAVKLGYSPLELATPITYDNMGRSSTVNIDNPFNDEAAIAYSEIGSCLFVGTLAISARIDSETVPNMTDYVVAWQAVPNNRDYYRGTSSLDQIKFIVTNDGTEVYFNGLYVFTFKNMKREDFAKSNYMAYPYFAFSEYPAQPDKNNVLHVKGVNAPTGESGTVKKFKKADGTLKFKLETYGEEVSLFTDKEFKQAVSTSMFTCENGELSIKSDYFNGKPYGISEFYAKTENGVEVLKVRYVPDTYVQLMPEIESKDVDELGNALVTFDRKIVTGYTVENGAVTNIQTEDSTLDLRVKLNLKGHEFVKIYGWGMSSASYMYNERQSIVLIRNSFLMHMDNGEYALILVTKDSDGVEQETRFTVKIINYSAFEVKAEEPQKGGCGGYANSSLPLIALPILATALFMAKTRKSIKNI